MPHWLWQAGLYAAGAFAACEGARLMVSRLAEVWKHAESTWGYGTGGVVLADVIAVLSAVFLEWRYRMLSNTRLARLGLGLVAGGMVANLFEMVALGSVTDYVPVGDWRLSGGDVAAIAGLVVFAAITLFRAARSRRRSQ